MDILIPRLSWHEDIFFRPVEKPCAPPKKISKIPLSEAKTLNPSSSGDDFWFASAVRLSGNITVITHHDTLVRESHLFHQSKKAKPINYSHL